MEFFPAIFESRKAGAFALASATVLFGKFLGATDAHIQDLVQLAMVYMGAQGVADVGVYLAKNGKSGAAASG